MRYRKTEYISDSRARVGVAMLAALLLWRCASLGGGAKYTGSVSVTAAHQILKRAFDTENLLVCGRATAPPAPACVPIGPGLLHGKISAELSKAFDLDGKVAKLVADMPACVPNLPCSPQPSELISMVADITAIVAAVVSELPASAQKTSLVNAVQGGQ